MISKHWSKMYCRDSLDKIETIFKLLLGEGEVNVFKMTDVALEKYYTLGDRAWNSLFGTDKHHIREKINIRIDWFVNGNHYVQAIASDSLTYNDNIEEILNFYEKYVERFKKARKNKEKE